ncbi:MAG: nucleoside triphosphate pyrophosphohydrolase [Cyanobacteria bacterium REEB459]|nr:nucleoside triphosphate pyrophosphohydrolase [Cyanobacteria bacterium REEB459]
MAASYPQPYLAALERLVQVVAQLRHPQTGCPWDRQQTLTSLIPYVLEEAYEVVDAIRSGDAEAIAEELGDLLLQVVLQAQIANDHQHFDLATVADGITEKLIRRHPHVFGQVTVADPEEVNRNWERIKAEEKGLTPESQGLAPQLSRYNRTLPPLTAASKISARAAKAGFDWQDRAGVWAKFQEELEEFRQAIAHEPQENQQAELGDLLFTLVNLARWYGLDAAAALHGTNRRFIQRFEQVEAALDKPLSDYSGAELEALWQAAKLALAQGSATA